MRLPYAEDLHDFGWYPSLLEAGEVFGAFLLCGFTGSAFGLPGLLGGFTPGTGFVLTGDSGADRLDTLYEFFALVLPSLLERGFDGLNLLRSVSGGFEHVAGLLALGFSYLFEGFADLRVCFPQWLDLDRLSAFAGIVQQAGLLFDLFAEFSFLGFELLRCSGPARFRGPSGLVVLRVAVRVLCRFGSLARIVLW